MRRAAAVREGRLKRRVQSARKVLSPLGQDDLDNRMATCPFWREFRGTLSGLSGQASGTENIIPHSRGIGQQNDGAMVPAARPRGADHCSIRLKNNHISLLFQSVRSAFCCDGKEFGRPVCLATARPPLCVRSDKGTLEGSSLDRYAEGGGMGCGPAIRNLA